MLIQVEVSSFAVDPTRNTPLLILKEISGNRSLAVPIGPLEASTIAMESLKVTPEKPLTIDLARIIMEQLGGELSRMIIYDLIDQTFLAQIQISTGTQVFSIDCRPCDAIALAMRCRGQMFINDRVFEKMSGKVLDENEQIRRNITSIDTTEFGRYILE